MRPAVVLPLAAGVVALAAVAWGILGGDAPAKRRAPALVEPTDAALPDARTTPPAVGGRAPSVPVRDAADEPTTLEPPAPPADPARDALVAELLAPGPGDPWDVLELEVRAVEPGPRWNAPRVPDVPFDLGLLGARNAPGEPLASRVTDGEGVARVFLRWDALERIEPRRELWARVRGPGLLERTGYLLLPERPEAAPGPGAEDPAPPGAHPPHVLEVLVQPGAVVEGRILGPDGAPVAGRPELIDADGSGTHGHLGVAGDDGRFRGEAWDEGRYVVHAAGSSAGRSPYELVWPEDLDLGTGVSEPFDVIFDGPSSFVEVTVSGPGVLTGRVLDDADRPVAGLDLRLTLARADGSAAGADRAGGGHTWSRTRTDEDGAFTVRGLRPGLFHVDASVGGGIRATDRLTDQPVPARGDPLELRLARRCLAVHVRTPDGEPAPDDLEAAGGGWLDAPTEEWPDEPSLLVLKASDLSWVDRLNALRPRKTGPGEFIVEFDDDEGDVDLDVAVFGGSVTWAPRRVHVAADAGRVDVDLTLPPSAPPGTLVLDVVDGKGRPLYENVRVRVEDPALGTALLDRPFDYGDEDDWPARFPLPPGTFRLVVEGHPWIDDHHGTLMEPRRHGAEVRELVVVAGEETPVTATLGEGARLRVRAAGSVTAAAMEAAREAWAWSVEEVVPERVREEASWVSLELRRPDRRPVYPLFGHHLMEGTSAAGNHLLPRVRLGEDLTSEVLSPGEYELVASTVDGRELRRDVRLSDGAVTDVVLVFD